MSQFSQVCTVMTLFQSKMIYTPVNPSLTIKMGSGGGGGVYITGVVNMIIGAIDLWRNGLEKVGYCCEWAMSFEP